MKVTQLVKSCIFNYPTLFETRLSVFIHLFSCIGNGYEWVNGELVSICGKDELSKKMKYDDLDEHISKNEKDLKDYILWEKKNKQRHCLRDLTESYLVNYKFKKLKRQFIEQNIDVISRGIEAGLKENYEVYLNYYMKNPCYDYAKIFHIPENITQDWGDAAQEFAKWWRSRLYSDNQGFCFPLINNKDNDKYAKSKIIAGYVYISSPDECWSEQCKKDFILAQKLLEIIDQIDIYLKRKTYSKQQKEMAKYVEKYLKKSDKK